MPERESGQALDGRYRCWFCDWPIERTDPGAVLVHVRGFWAWNDGSNADDDPAQDVYAHSACAKDRLKGATMTLEPSVFLEDDA